VTYREAPAGKSGPAAPGPQHLTARFAREPDEVAHARRTVGTAVEAWGLDEHRQALVLAVSEMVSNAVVHGAGDVEVTLGADDDGIRLEVWDEGGGRPRRRASDPTGGVPGGWGLQLVAELADEWGAEHVEGRTCVWLVRRR
jgi:anti-sigma regulatory factor (Ser/Thr protein kinase)